MAQKDHPIEFNQNEEDASNFRKRKYPFSHMDPYSEQFVSTSDPESTTKFTTYEKKQGIGQHLGGEYQYLMCALYALKFCDDDRISDFQLTTNNNKYKVFDDITIEITLKDSSEVVFTFQLKHGEPQRNLTIGDFVRQNLKNKSYLKNPYCLTKHIEFVKSIEKQNIVCVLFTNNTASLVDGLELDFETDKVSVKLCDDFVYTNLLVNTQSVNGGDIFRLTTSGKTDYDNASRQFYIFTNQNNVYRTKQIIEDELRKLLRCDVYGFFDFMKNWWAGNFVLGKTDMLTKLTELSLGPYSRTLSADKSNDKSRELAKSIMKFDTTIVEGFDHSVISSIWDITEMLRKIQTLETDFEMLAFSLGTSLQLESFCLAALKYGLKSMPASTGTKKLSSDEIRDVVTSLSLSQITKVLWYLDVVPLVVKISHENREQVEAVLSLWWTHFKRKKIVLVGPVDKEKIQEKWKLLCTLSDFEKYDRNRVMTSFQVSLQGKSAIPLKQLLHLDKHVADIFGVRELLEMTQDVLVVGKKDVTCPSPYVERTLSATLLETNKVLKAYENNTDALIIINCEKTLHFAANPFVMVELTEFLKNRHYDDRLNVIIVSTKSKCNTIQFESVQRFTHKSVYLLQVVNDTSCVLLSKTGDALPLDELKQESQSVEDRKVLTYFKNPLNCLVGPVASGKSTLLAHLVNQCPSHSWTVYVNLKTANTILESNPDYEELLRHFLQLSDEDSFLNKFKHFVVKTKKLYLFLDELDQVTRIDFVLDFVRWMACAGVFVWVAARDYLEEKIVTCLNIVPVKLQALTQIEQNRGPLFGIFSSRGVAKMVYKSLEMADSALSLATPLNIRTIADFVKDQTVLERLKSQKVLPLPVLVTWLFDGIFKHYLSKMSPESSMVLVTLKDYYLEQYQLLALKSCLEETSCYKLLRNPRRADTFLGHLQQHGDNLGIVTSVENQPVFFHRTFAESLASLWLSENLQYPWSPDKNYFSSGLRFTLDVLLSENNPQHLSIIYRDFDNVVPPYDESKDKGGRTLLHLVCSYGNHYPPKPNYHERLNRESPSYVELVEQLMKVQDPSNRDDLFSFTTITYAVRCGCLLPLDKVVDLSPYRNELLEAYDTKTLAFYCSQLGYLKLLGFVIEKDPSVLNDTFDGFSLPELAVLGAKDDDYQSPRPGNVKVAEMLIQRCDNEDVLSRMLTLASTNQCYDMVEVLSRLDSKKTKGKTLLHVAAEMGTLNEEMLKLSVKKDTDLSVLDEEGRTPLHIASEKGYVNIVQLLLDKGVLINSQSVSKWTPLHYAVKSSNVDVVKFLVERGVDINVRDFEGRTSLDLAHKCGNEKYVKFLLKGALDWKQEEKLSSDFQTNLTIHKSEKMETATYSEPRKSTEFPEQTFKKRAGTTDKGRDYEILILANLIFKLVTDTNVTNFSVSANDESFGYFDDIVVSVATQTNVTTYALQVKHTVRGKPITEKQLTQNRGMFSLTKSFQSFKEMSEGSCDLIYFTNAKLFLPENKELNFDDEHLKVRVVQTSPDSFLSTTNEEDACYKFKLGDLEDTNLQLKDKYQHFFDHFYMYTSQESVDQVEQRLCTDFTSTFGCTRSVFAQYLNFITTWSMRDGTKEKLAKTWVESAIALILLSSCVKPLSFGPVNDKMRLLRDAIAKFWVTVVEDRAYDVVRKLWGDLKTENDDLKLLNKVALKYQLLRYFTNTDEIDDKLMNMLLWILGKCPLIVSQDDCLPSTLDLCQNKNFVVVGKYTNVHENVFRKLSDLKWSKEVYDEILKRFRFLVQGNEEIDLEFLTTLDSKFVDSVTPTDLVDMVETTYRVGGEKNLSSVYLTRFLSRNVISSKYLEKIDPTNTLVLLCDAKGTNLRTVPDRSDLFSKNELPLKKFDDWCTSVSAKVFHYFKIIEDGNLEWLQSKGGVEDLHQYQMSGYFVEEAEVYSDCQSKVNVICAEPGMGKSELLKRLKSEMKPLTVLLTMSEMSSLGTHLNEKSLDEIQETIFKLVFAECEPLEEKIVKVLIKSGQVCYMWDGLDELTNENRALIIDLVKQLSSRSLTQWITARSTLKKELEHKFGVLARSLRPLTSEEQNCYIRMYLETENERNALDKTLIKIKSLPGVSINEILAYPLQLHILLKLLQTDISFHKLSLGDLYSQFIEQKYNTYIGQKTKIDTIDPMMKKIFERHKKSVFENYEKIAVRTLCPEHVQEQSFVDDELEDYLGLLTNGHFINSSFAEYFAACYLQRSRTNLIFLFDTKYSNVRFFFDLLLAKNSVAHTAVVHKDFDLLKTQEGFEKSKDLGGRSVLHLACSWGTRYPVLNVQKNPDGYVIDDCTSEMVKEDPDYLKIVDFLLERCDTMDVDDLFKMTPGAYADATNSVFAKIKILLKEPKVCRVVDEDLTKILYYSVKFGVSEVIDLFKDIPLVCTATDQNSLLHLAVHDVKIVEKLLQFGTYLKCVNLRNKYGETPLHLASRLGYRDSMLVLIRFGSDFNSVNTNGLSPLHLACQNGHTASIMVLIESGANLDGYANDGTTPLHLACQSGNGKCVEMLIRSGVKINVRNKDGITPLHISCQTGNVEITEMLVRIGAEIDVLTSNGHTPLHVACQNGHLECVDILIKCGANVDRCSADGTTALHLACQSGNGKCVEMLIRNAVNINVRNKNGITPLHVSCQTGNVEITEILVRIGAEIDVLTNNGRTPLHLACQNGHLECAELLIQCGADINRYSEDGTTALHLACQSGSARCAELLIHCGTNINVPNKDGITPLHVSCQTGNLEITEMLVHSGANVSALANTGPTPLHLASENGHLKCVEFLIQCGADINRSSSDGTTALHSACQSGSVDVVKMLLQLGAGINVASSDGTTPLHLACEKGRDAVVRLLIECGADATATNFDHMTPLGIALRENHKQIVELLKRFHK